MVLLTGINYAKMRLCLCEVESEINDFGREPRERREGWGEEGV